MWHAPSFMTPRPHPHTPTSSTPRYFFRQRTIRVIVRAPICSEVLSVNYSHTMNSSATALSLSLSLIAASALCFYARRRLRRRRIITDEQWHQFDRDGYCILAPEQVFASPADDLAMLQQRIDDIMLDACVERPPYEQMMMQLDSSTGDYADAGEQTLGFKGKTLRYRKIQNLDLDALVMAYLRLPCFREACSRVYGEATPIASFRTMFFNKPSSHSSGQAGGTRLPWHQDRWRFLDIDPLLNAYLALDPATPESGCVRILPGSHKLGVLNPEHHSAFLTEEQIERHCGAEAEATPGAILDLRLAPGEVALIHNWVIHSSGVNRTARPRRALSVSYMDARTYISEAEFGQFTGGELKSSGYPEGGTSFPLVFGGRAVDKPDDRDHLIGSD